MDKLFFVISSKNYGLNPAKDSFNQIYLFFEITMFIFALIFAFFVSFLFYLLFRYPQFHTNFNILLINTFIAYVVLTLGRQISLLEIYRCADEKDCYLSELMAANKVIYAEIMKYTGMIAYLVSTYSVIAERTWATVYLKGYEKKSSLKFMIIILLLQWFVSYLIVHFLITAKVPPMIIVIIAVIVTLILGIIFAIMKRVNEKRYYFSKNIGSNYTLSERYQLAENIKTAPIVTAILKVAFSMNNLILAVIIFILYTSDIFQKQIGKLIFDFLLTIYAPIICLATIPHVERWKIILAKYFIKKPTSSSTNLNTAACSKIAKNSNQVNVLRKNEADVYFIQLAKGWA